MSNPALRIAGPAVITYKGATFASKGDIALNPSNETFDLEASPYGIIDSRSSGKPVTLTFTPVGVWSALSVLWPAALQIIGQLNTPVRGFAPAAVDTADDKITLAGHPWESGAAVRFFSFGALPAGLTAGDLVYLHKVDADTVTVHASRAAAVAGTDPLDLTDAGTGRHRVIEQEPLVIVSSEGERYTFHVAALGGLPAINGTTANTLIGEVTFECYRKAGVPATTADSLFTLDDAVYSPPAIDPTQILTQAYTLTWGAAPWAGLETVAGIAFEFGLTLVDVLDDAQGVTAKRVDGLTVIARAQPLGVHSADVLAKLKLQGEGAQRGGRLAGTDDLVMAATGVAVSMTAAALRNAPHTFGRSADRIGGLEWFATRKFTAGVPQPLFTVGTGA